MSQKLAWLGLGGNVGDVRSTMIAALQILDGHSQIEIVRVSGLYVTPPWGKVDQPDFLNACAEIRTSLTPRGLLGACLQAEQALQRMRRELWGPRTIDIDIHAMNGIEIAEDGLTVPHALLTSRAFALVPLCDLVPSLVVNGRSAEAWLSRFDTDQIRQLAPPSQWLAGSPPWTGD